MDDITDALRPPEKYAHLRWHWLKGRNHIEPAEWQPASNLWLLAGVSGRHSPDRMSPWRYHGPCDPAANGPGHEGHRVWKSRVAACGRRRCAMSLMCDSPYNCGAEAIPSPGYFSKDNFYPEPSSLSAASAPDPENAEQQKLVRQIFAPDYDHPIATDRYKIKADDLTKRVLTALRDMGKSR